MTTLFQPLHDLTPDEVTILGLANAAGIPNVGRILVAERLGLEVSKEIIQGYLDGEAAERHHQEAIRRQKAVQKLMEGQ